jgi:hypothetical protein
VVPRFTLAERALTDRTDRTDTVRYFVRAHAHFFLLFSHPPPPKKALLAKYTHPRGQVVDDSSMKCAFPTDGGGGGADGTEHGRQQQ